VQAWVRAADSDVQGALNVSTGRETSLLELVGALEVEPIHESGRPGEIARSCLHPGRAAAELGWTAATPLRQGLLQTRRTSLAA
jgi:UDP-glucose 4-epimerase